MSEDEREAGLAKSPVGKEAQQLADVAWERARAHALTDEERLVAIERLRALADREPDEDERGGINAEIRLLEKLFDLVEQEERETPIHDSEILQEAYAVYGAASHYEPGPDETPDDRQAHLQRLHEAIRKLSKLMPRCNEVEHEVVDDLITELWKVYYATEFVARGDSPDRPEADGA